MLSIQFRIRPRLSLVLSCCFHFNTSLNEKRNEHARHLAPLGSVPLWIFTSVPLPLACFSLWPSVCSGCPVEMEEWKGKLEEGGKDQQFLVIVLQLQLPSTSLPCHASVTLLTREYERDRDRDMAIYGWRVLGVIAKVSGQLARQRHQIALGKLTSRMASDYGCSQWGVHFRFGQESGIISTHRRKAIEKGEKRPKQLGQLQHL